MTKVAKIFSSMVNGTRKKGISFLNSLKVCMDRMKSALSRKDNIGGKSKMGETAHVAKPFESASQPQEHGFSHDSGDFQVPEESSSGNFVPLKGTPILT